MEHAVAAGDVWRQIAALVLTASVVMGGPGPATIGVTAVAAGFGARRARPFLAGVILGTVVVLFAVACGLVSMLMSLPRLAPVLLAASTGYILVLAYRIAIAPPLSPGAEAARVPSFRGGFVLGVANPKAYLAIAAVFAGTTLPHQPPALEAAIKTAILGVMIVAIYLCWLLVGASLSAHLRDPLWSRIVNLVLGAILVAAAIGPMLR